MTGLNPYLNFNGNTEEAFNFYRSVFGGEFVTLQRFKDMPEVANVSAKDQEKIMHVSLPIGKETVLMGSDALESMGQPLAVGNNFPLSIKTESEDETRNIFNAISTGGKITMPLDKTFWGAYFGMCTDKFGVQWMVNYDYK